MLACMSEVPVKADTATFVGAVDCVTAAKAVVGRSSENFVCFAPYGQRTCFSGAVRENPCKAAEAGEVLWTVQTLLGEV